MLKPFYIHSGTWLLGFLCCISTWLCPLHRAVIDERHTVHKATVQHARYQRHAEIVSTYSTQTTVIPFTPRTQLHRTTLTPNPALQYAECHYSAQRKTCETMTSLCYAYPWRPTSRALPWLVRGSLALANTQRSNGDDVHMRNLFSGGDNFSEYGIARTFTIACALCGRVLAVVYLL